MEVSHPEYGYLNLARQIIDSGDRREDRTGVGTLSKFGAQLRFNLQKGFPLLTTKRVYWKGIVEELLWFISGSTDSKVLANRGVHIWDGNGSRAFLDSRDLMDYPEGQLGPVYGFQWRHFGAHYTTSDADYTGQGIDQLAECIAQIRNDPTSRRIIMSAWNPCDLHKMALPPCHVLCQFYVHNNRLSCHLYQRSADMGLGVPFNIASYALLTHMIAHVCQLNVGELIHSFGDVHVYLNHVTAMEEQLKREPLPFPTLWLDSEIINIDNFKVEHIKLLNYQCREIIKMPMAM